MHNIKPGAICRLNFYFYMSAPCMWYIHRAHDLTDNIWFLLFNSRIFNFDGHKSRLTDFRE